MDIDYWDCEFEEADQINLGSTDEPDYEWVYGCRHPVGDGVCHLNNKYAGAKDDCKLLD